MVRVQSQHFDFVALSPLFVQLEALSRFALFWHDVHLSNQTPPHTYLLQSLHQLKLVTQHKLRPVQHKYSNPIEMRNQEFQRFQGFQGFQSQNCEQSDEEAVRERERGESECRLKIYGCVIIVLSRNKLRINS